jgi:hypothetical protein
MLSFLADERKLTPFAILKNLPKENLRIKIKTISVHNT